MKLKSWSDELAGGGEQPLCKPLPRDYMFNKENTCGDMLMLGPGAIELHRCVLEDNDRLERRPQEINDEFVNAVCSVNGRYYNEVSDALLSPLPSPGHAVVARLLLQSLGLGDPTAVHGRGSKHGRKNLQWNSMDAPVLCSYGRLH